ncbi:MAG: hypothetical protein GY845_37325 [Planctomycetes bacterium]|nr:hypothetical protein [Planctomycetota bacterium]
MAARKRKVRNPQRMVAVVDVRTAADLLDISTSTLYRWMADGDVAYATLPSGVRRIPLPEIAKITGMPVEAIVRLLQFGG